jgi:very-short-patch-repair endonuclease
MTWSEYFRVHNMQIAETAALNAAGANWRALRAAVESGQLVRARRGHYALPGTDAHILEAVRLGGRLACMSAVANAGIFTLDSTFAHIHVQPTASRLRAPHDRFQKLSAQNRDGVELHWGQLLDPRGGSEYCIGLADAFVQVFRCQETRFAIASLENALFTRRLGVQAVAQIFAALPEEFQPLRPLINGRSESGQETVLRLVIRGAGFHVEIQVEIGGIGRVDMIVEGRVVVEADSRQFHDGWEAHARDRTRDCDLAMRGYVSLRVLYRDIVHHPERIIAAITGLLAATNRYRTFIV